MTLRGKLGP